MKKLTIVFASSEVYPYAKTGGLADVVGVLPQHLARMGHDVKIITPFYRQTRKGGFDIRRFPKRIFVQMGDKIVEGELATTRQGHDVDVYFVVKDDYYDRDELYRSGPSDYKDNAERFIFFSKAVLSTLEEMEIRPDILHCHDWQTGLVGALLKTIERGNPFFLKTKTVFTIHNLAFQGLFWHYDMHMTNLPWDVFTPEGIEFYGKINLLKAGLVYSDMLTTVSRKYSEEIKTREYGCGLEGVLSRREKDLAGIVNGVDYAEWNPEHDPHIPFQYSLSHFHGKAQCKKHLLQELSLAIDPSRPLIGMISRLTEQKGFDLLLRGVESILARNVGLVLLGSGDVKYQKFFEDLAGKYPGRVGIRFGFDTPLSHRIEAGCDFYLMPSRFEPCGLNQIYSLKYGTVPIVRAAGGLDDTIQNFNPRTLHGNGFKFQDYTPDALLEKVGEALAVYEDPGLFHEVVRNGMKADFSWEKSAKQYEDVYLKALKETVI